MSHSADDFAMLSSRHVSAANRSGSREQWAMHLEIAHHYARVAALKGRSFGG